MTGDDVTAALAAAPAAVQITGAPCAACGRPFRPAHDASAPGPTVRHIYRPRGYTSPRDDRRDDGDDDGGT